MDFLTLGVKQLVSPYFQPSCKAKLTDCYWTDIRVISVSKKANKYSSENAECIILKLCMSSVVVYHITVNIVYAKIVLCAW